MSLSSTTISAADAGRYCVIFIVALLFARILVNKITRFCRSRRALRELRAHHR